MGVQHPFEAFIKQSCILKSWHIIRCFRSAEKRRKRLCTGPTRSKSGNATLWGVGLGLWGAISGIALFLTWDSFWRHHPWVAFWELLLAVIAAYVGESARECVEGHEHRETSIVTSILILVALEFFRPGLARCGRGVESGHLAGCQPSYPGRGFHDAARKTVRV